jgi:nicotinamidase-related amidase
MFGWERFLTKRDRLHDQSWGKKELYGFGSRPALLLVDFYYASVGDRREDILESIKRWPYSAGLEGWSAIDRTQEILRVAREHGIPIIHVKGLDLPIKPWVHARRTMPPMPSDRAAKGREIVAELAPEHGEVVIEKTAPSAFQGTPLMFHLNSLNVDTIICCGETTSGCIRATVVDGASARFHMGVVAECVFDRTEASHFVSLYDMHQRYADVVSLDHARRYLEGITDYSHNRPGQMGT